MPFLPDEDARQQIVYQILYFHGCSLTAFLRAIGQSRLFALSRLVVAAPLKKKEPGGRVKKESDSTFPPVPEGKEGRAFIYISFESGRPVITAAALALFHPFPLSSPLSRSLSIFSVLALRPSSAVRGSLLLSVLLFALLLPSQHTTTTSINPDTTPDNTFPTDPSSCWPISGPHYQSTRERRCESRGARRRTRMKNTL